MVKLFFCGLVCAFVIGCQGGQDTIYLRWQIPEGSHLGYAVTISDIPVKPELAVHGFDLLDDLELRAQIKTELARVDIPLPTFKASITSKENLLEASVIGVAPEYDQPPKDEDEAFQRRMSANRAGYVELLGNFSHEGQLQDFYLRQQQRNLLNLFFSMPKSPVYTSDSWLLDVRLTEIGPGFYPQETERVSRAYLEAIEEIDGIRVARILYVVSERVAGHFQYHVEDPVTPIESNYSHIGYGSFIIGEGRWKNFTMVAYLSGSGLSQSESMKIYALQSKDK